MIKSIKIMNYIVKEMFNRKTKAFLICENSENSISKCDSFPFKDKKSRFFIFERKSIKLLHYGQKELYPY